MNKAYPESEFEDRFDFIRLRNIAYEAELQFHEAKKARDKAASDFRNFNCDGKPRPTKVVFTSSEGEDKIVATSDKPGLAFDEIDRLLRAAKLCEELGYTFFIGKWVKK